MRAEAECDRTAAEIAFPSQRHTPPDSFDYLADFSGEFHDLRDAPSFADCLDPNSYVKSQALAEQLLEAGSLGTVYPSVRRAGGTCIACFRPALVMSVRKGTSYRFQWSGEPTHAISPAR
jgi:hypothetical protein